MEKIQEIIKKVCKEAFNMSCLYDGYRIFKIINPKNEDLEFLVVAPPGIDKELDDKVSQKHLYEEVVRFNC